MNFPDRMTSLTDIDGSVFAYEFDGEGNRLSQSLNDCLSKRFVYDGADVLLELNPTNGVAYAWVNGPGIDQPVERLLFIDGSPRARRVFHADALGSVAALTDPSGLVTQSYAYAAFGALRSSAGTDLNRVTYTGREQLGDSQGWMYYRHRVFIPNAGRFLQADPGGFLDGANLYSYVRNPLVGRDPSGLWSGIDDAVFALGGAVLGIFSQAVSDLVAGSLGTWGDYAGAAIGGAVSAEVLLYSANPYVAGAAGAFAGNLASQGFNCLAGEQEGFNRSHLVVDLIVGTALGSVPGRPKLAGINKGRGSQYWLFRKQRTEMIHALQQGTQHRVSVSTAGKMMNGAFYQNGMYPSAPLYGVADGAYRRCDSCPE